MKKTIFYNKESWGYDKTFALIKGEGWGNGSTIRTFDEGKTFITLAGTDIILDNVVIIYE